jgi:hypothetical protein
MALGNPDDLNFHTAWTVVNLQCVTAEQHPPVLLDMLLLQCYIILLYNGTQYTFCGPKNTTDEHRMQYIDNSL